MSTLRNFPGAAYGWGLAVCLLAVCSTVMLWPLRTNAQDLPTATCANNSILLVVSSVNLEPRDATLVVRLLSQGYTVDIKTGKKVTSADATGKALVIVSESVLSDDINNKFREVAVPLLTWEAWIYDNLSMTGPKVEHDYGELQPETQVRISDPNHPLAAGLTGDVPLLNQVGNAQERKFHWGVPGNGAVIVAVNRRAAGYAHIFAYEQGAAMVGMTAPARRVGFPNGSAQRFTAEGWRLFDAAVTWAIACSVNPTATATPPTPGVTATATTTDPDETPVPTATFIVTTPPTSPTPVTPAATATMTPTATKRPPPGATPTPTATPGGPAQLSIAKVDFLFRDADQNDLVSAGDTLLYAIKINNSGGQSAYQIRLVDPPDPNSTLVVGTVTTDVGTVVKGNNPGDAHVVIEVPELVGGGRVLISFQAQVNAQINQASLQNQAITTFVDQIPEPRSQTTIVSDDPDTPGSLDTTVTVLNSPVAQLNRKLFLPIMAR